MRAGAWSVALLACAASAGAHAGLLPQHLREEPRLGYAFLVAVLVLVAAGGALALRPADGRVALACALLFAGLIAAYVASRTSGLPWLQPQPEAFDAVGAVTNVVELLGLGSALVLIQPVRRDRRRFALQEV